MGEFNVNKTTGGLDPTAGMPETYPADQVMMSDGVTSVEEAVDELAENVSTLSNRVGAHTFGTAVNVATYTAANKYTCPSDGYIRYETSGSAPTAAIYMGGKMYGYVNTATAGNIFVKKGAKIHCTTVNNTTVEFIPLS